MIVLIDNYDSFTYNLVHYFQELNYKVKVFRNDDKTSNHILNMEPKYIVISPGPSAPKNAGICIDLLSKNSKLKTPIPVLGVCLGHQAIGAAFGSKIIKANQIMHGKISNVIHDGSEIFKNIESPFQATRYHSLVIDPETLSKDFSVNAWTEDGTIMGIKHNSQEIYGLQFHPESLKTMDGMTMLNNFLKVND